MIQNEPDGVNNDAPADEEHDTSVCEEPGGTIGDDGVTLSPSASSAAKPRTPLMLRRLRNYNDDGVKQQMVNPLGRRAGGRR